MLGESLYFSACSVFKGHVSSSGDVFTEEFDSEFSDVLLIFLPSFILLSGKMRLQINILARITNHIL